MVDEEAFVLLDEETLKEMVKAVGPRVKLLKKLKEMQVYTVKINVLSPVQTTKLFLDNFLDSFTCLCLMALRRTSFF